MRFSSHDTYAQEVERHLLETSPSCNLRPTGKGISPWPRRCPCRQIPARRVKASLECRWPWWIAISFLWTCRKPVFTESLDNIVAVCKKQWFNLINHWKSFIRVGFRNQMRFCFRLEEFHFHESCSQLNPFQSCDFNWASMNFQLYFKINIDFWAIAETFEPTQYQFQLHKYLVSHLKLIRIETFDWAIQSCLRFWLHIRIYLKDFS